MQEFVGIGFAGQWNQKRDKEDRQLITEFLLSDPRKNTRRDSIPRLTEEALEWIFEQPWPGNVRELDGVLLRSLTNHPEVPTIRREQRRIANLDEARRG